MDSKKSLARWAEQIVDLDSRIARLRAEPGALSGLLGAELIELLERTLADLKRRRPYPGEFTEFTEADAVAQSYPGSPSASSPSSP